MSPTQRFLTVCSLAAVLLLPVAAATADTVPALEGQVRVF